MKKSNSLLTLLNNSSNWDDIYHQLLNYGSAQKNLTGKLFEEFCKYYYLVEPTVKHDYKNVWLFSETPYTTKKKLNLGKVDHGIDLVLEGRDGTLSVVQCKFRGDQNSNISWTKDNLANLFADGDKADYFIVFTNASGLDKHSLSKKSNQLKLVTFGDLLSISLSTISQMKARIFGLIEAPIEIKKPKDYQQKAIEEVINGFKKHDRGQLILPCGAGKTLASLWIKNKLNAKHTLVLVPSLALLRQIKDEWTINCDRFIPYICVCSEKDIDKGKDHATVHTYEICGKVSTDPNEIQKFLNNNKKTIVYSTYQSLDVICNAIKNSDFSFDLAVCDEAHKTSGSKLSKFGLIHSNVNVSVKKRLYMTATPRVIGNNLKNESNQKVINFIHDMGNPNIFGPELYRMSFKEAIDKKILVDYKIVAIGVNHQELERAIKQRKYISNNETIDEIANNYALAKFMEENKSTHSITFHSSVKKAKLFQKRHQEIYKDISTYHVNGDQTTNERSICMKEFETSPISIITNARCLTEGIDMPAIDVVYFCDPRNSKIDIVQAVGRALRRADHKNKVFGYIVVPIFHREKEKIEEAIHAGPFRNLMSVIRALSSHDERLIGEIQNIKIGLSEKKLREEHILINQSINLITIQGFREKLQQYIFNQIISSTKIIYVEFKVAFEYAQSLGLKSQKEWFEHKNRPINIPYNPSEYYKDKGWKSWGYFLGTNRIANQNKKYRDFHEARKYAISLGLNNCQEWRTFVKSCKLPSDIPANPNTHYKDKGWKSWSDWLGNQNIAPKNKMFKTYVEAIKFVHTLNLKSQREWSDYCKSGKKPSDIPYTPSRYYKGKGWVNWGVWLGTHNIAPQDKFFLPFIEARKQIHLYKIKSQREFRKLCREKKLPENIPTNPEIYYEKSGWVGWGDWLGTYTVAAKNTKYFSLEEAKKYIHPLKLKTVKEFREYCKKNKPKYIPTNPNIAYKKEGWISWPDFLRNKNNCN